MSFLDVDNEHRSPPAPIKNLTHDDSSYSIPNCGSQAGDKKCKGGLCCSYFGFCGDTKNYCGEKCQSGPCTGGGGKYDDPKTPPPANN
ncbi:Acidic endochitinase WIN6.2C (Fragment) [Linum grandiflorum]